MNNMFDFTLSKTKPSLVYCLIVGLLLSTSCKSGDQKASANSIDNSCMIKAAELYRKNSVEYNSYFQSCSAEFEAKSGDDTVGIILEESQVEPPTDITKGSDPRFSSTLGPEELYLKCIHNRDELAKLDKERISLMAKQAFYSRPENFSSEKINEINSALNNIHEQINSLLGNAFRGMPTPPDRNIVIKYKVCNRDEFIGD
jgi:hypothetical protein